jgi:hypothetical protein
LLALLYAPSRQKQALDISPQELASHIELDKAWNELGLERDGEELVVVSLRGNRAGQCTLSCSLGEASLVD